MHHKSKSISSPVNPNPFEFDHQYQSTYNETFNSQNFQSNIEFQSTKLDSKTSIDEVVRLPAPLDLNELQHNTSRILFWHLAQHLISTSSKLFQTDPSFEIRFDSQQSKSYSTRIEVHSTPMQLTNRCWVPVKFDSFSTLNCQNRFQSRLNNQYKSKPILTPIITIDLSSKTFDPKTHSKVLTYQKSQSA